MNSRVLFHFTIQKFPFPAAISIGRRNASVVDVPGVGGSVDGFVPSNNMGHFCCHHREILHTPEKISGDCVVSLLSEFKECCSRISFCAIVVAMVLDIVPSGP